MSNRGADWKYGDVVKLRHTEASWSPFWRFMVISQTEHYNIAAWPLVYQTPHGTEFNDRVYLNADNIEKVE